MRALIGYAALAIAVGIPRGATASPALFVGTADDPPLAGPAHVVLMRDGARTVVSLQPSYRGPHAAVAMVVPVPAAVRAHDVRVLPRELFEHVEQLTAPRLVQYWEQDPCLAPGSNAPAAPPAPDPADAVGEEIVIDPVPTSGEYQITVLAVKDLAAVDSWLRDHGYQLPRAAEPTLRGYLDSGMKLLVAEIDKSKVPFEGERALLSPLRFHHDGDRFVLPIRAGHASSSGTQDVFVHLLASSRYEVVGHKNVPIPTNLDVAPTVPRSFAGFYAALFDRTVDVHRGAVVTEYAWDAASCAPCPAPALDRAQLQLLGGDVTGAPRDGLVLTRLHARYGKDIERDLEFRPAPAISGGRGLRVAGGQLATTPRSSERNAFQARYAIRHPWLGPLRCESPRRGMWGPPPAELALDAPPVIPALGVGSAPSDGVVLESTLLQDAPEIDVIAGGVTPQPGRPGLLAATHVESRSGGCRSTSHAAGWGVLAAFVLLRRRRARPSDG